MDLAPRNRTNHPRSVRAARLAYTVKRTTERRGRIPSRIREPLRRVYQRVNSGKAPKAMTPELRHELEELYRESNEQTAEALRRHGYTELPTWLHAKAPAD